MMGDEADYHLMQLFDEDLQDDEEGRQPKELRCRYCGADTVYWAERAGKWVLYDFTSSRRHVCRERDLALRSQQIADAFEDIS